MDSKDSKDYISGRLGVDYHISDKSSIGTIVRVRESYPDNKDYSYIDVFNDDSVHYSQILTNGNATETDKTYLPIYISSKNWIHYLGESFH